MDSGIARKIDDLGRIVIPAETRKLFNIREGDHLFINVEGGSIVIRKMTVRVLDRIGGLIDGMSVGLAIGASVGALTGSSGDMADYENRNAKAAGGAFVGGMLMGGFGMLLGSSRGAKQCYRFRWDGGAGNTPAPPPSKPLVTY
jgi:transcriptional pleiotropic regulator of transition state genes